MPDANRWLGRVIGNGHCVALLQRVGHLPPTTHWRPGVKVRGSNSPAGTAIATFGGDPPRYQNRAGSSHAAVLIEEAPHGIWVYDQWLGQPVHRRLIAFRGNAGRASNNADKFFVILV